MKAKLIEIRENNKELSNAAEAAKDVLYEEYNIAINHAAGIPTIGYTFIKEAVKYLSENKKEGEDTRLELFDLLTLGINFTDTSEDEKLNNFEPTVIPGPGLTSLIQENNVDNDDEE